MEANRGPCQTTPAARGTSQIRYSSYHSRAGTARCHSSRRYNPVRTTQENRHERPDIKTDPTHELAHGGGCGCKLAPAVLESILARSGAGFAQAAPVGIETATTPRLSDQPIAAIVATTDFFMPWLTIPSTSARSATNAISDVYAMRPPRCSRWHWSACRSSVAGGDDPQDPRGRESVCAKAGIPIAAP